MATTTVKFFHSAMTGAPQISATAGSLLAVLDAVLVNGFGLQSVGSASVAGGICTLTVPTNPSAQVGSVVLVAGATPTTLNGQQRVTAVGANTLSFATTATGSITGSITVKVAPAGWLKAYSATNKAAYKINRVLYPESPAMLVRIDDTTADYANLAGFAAMTSITAGTGPIPATGAFYIPKLSGTSDNTTRQWLVVADERFVYIGIASMEDYGSIYGPAWCGFGQFASKKTADSYSFMVSGVSNTTVNTYLYGNHSLASTNGANHHIARSHTGLGGSVGATLKTWPSDYQASGGNTAPLIYPNPTDAGLYLCPADVCEGADNLRGRLPGMLLIPHNVGGQICPNAYTAYQDSAIPAFPGKTIGFMPCANNIIDTFGVVAFDLTGPWEY